jgi:hypothetical protein
MEGTGSYICGLRPIGEHDLLVLTKEKALVMNLEALLAAQEESSKSTTYQSDHIPFIPGDDW